MKETKLFIILESDKLLLKTWSWKQFCAMVKNVPVELRDEFENVNN